MTTPSHANAKELVLTTLSNPTILARIEHEMGAVAPRLRMDALLRRGARVLQVGDKLELEGAVAEVHGNRVTKTRVTLSDSPTE